MRADAPRELELRHGGALLAALPLPQITLPMASSSSSSAAASGGAGASGGGGGSDRANVNLSFSRNWEHLQNRFVGTGHPDMSKFEWVVNHHRDSLASHIGHADQLAYFAVAEGESIGRVRYTMLEKMLQPCGPPPPERTEPAAVALAAAAAAAAATTSTAAT